MARKRSRNKATALPFHPCKPPECPPEACAFTISPPLVPTLSVATRTAHPFGVRCEPLAMGDDLAPARSGRRAIGDAVRGGGKRPFRLGGTGGDGPPGAACPQHASTCGRHAGARNPARRFGGRVAVPHRSSPPALAALPRRADALHPPAALCLGLAGGTGQRRLASLHHLDHALAVRPGYFLDRHRLEALGARTTR